MSKKEYIAPTLTIVTFKSELGYAASSQYSMRTFNLLSAFMVAEPTTVSQESWGTEETNLFDTW